MQTNQHELGLESKSTGSTSMALRIQGWLHYTRSDYASSLYGAVSSNYAAGLRMLLDTLTTLAVCPIDVSYNEKQHITGSCLSPAEYHGIRVTDTYKSGRLLGRSAHLLSRDLVSQSFVVRCQSARATRRHNCPPWTTAAKCRTFLCRVYWLHRSLSSGAFGDNLNQAFVSYFPIRVHLFFYSVDIRMQIKTSLL
jgi:hypothetical protein